MKQHRKFQSLVTRHSSLVTALALAMATVSATAETVSIASASDWASFATRVNAGETSLDAIMTADVALDAGAPRIGDTKAAPWTGDFDGNGKRLTIAFKTTATGTDRNADLPAAPFAYVGGKAKVHDLHVLGTAETNGRFAAGVFGWVVEAASLDDVDVKILNCRVSVAIKCTTEGDATSGGFVGAVQNRAKLAMVDCLFDGSFIGDAANSCGGFVGFRRDTAYSAAADCLFAPSAIGIEETGCFTLVRYTGESGNSSFNTCYYTRAFGTAQGDNASSMAADDLAAALGQSWTNMNGKVTLVMFANVNPGTRDSNSGVDSFAYQGVLRDAQGHALQTLNHTVAFRLYDQATGGIPLWGRSQSVMLDTNGLFVVRLGDNFGDAIGGVASNGLAAAFAANSGGTLYIGLSVDGEASEIMPRQKLLATPYATWTADSSHASGDMAVAGAATAASLAVTGDMSASSFSSSGATTAGSLTVTRDMDVGDKAAKSGNLVVKGSVSGAGTIPIGGIVIWSGSAAEVPHGWALCNGQVVNGRATPNLKGRFVVGHEPGNGEYRVGGTGGEKRHRLTESEMPSHSHEYSFKGADLDLAWKDHNYFFDASEHYPNNSRTRTTDSTGGNGAHENRPPYYVVCYIMRVR